jgi:uncharacterized membrane protein
VRWTWALGIMQQPLSGFLLCIAHPLLAFLLLFILMTIMFSRGLGLFQCVLSIVFVNWRVGLGIAILKDTSRQHWLDSGVCFYLLEVVHNRSMGGT